MIIPILGDWVPVERSDNGLETSFKEWIRPQVATRTIDHKSTSSSSSEEEDNVEGRVGSFRFSPYGIVKTVSEPSTVPTDGAFVRTVGLSFTGVPDKLESFEDGFLEAMVLFDALDRVWYSAAEQCHKEQHSIADSFDRACRMRSAHDSKLTSSSSFELSWMIDAREKMTRAGLLGLLFDEGWRSKFLKALLDVVKDVERTLMYGTGAYTNVFAYHHEVTDMLIHYEKSGLKDFCVTESSLNRHAAVNKRASKYASQKEENEPSERPSAYWVSYTTIFERINEDYCKTIKKKLSALERLSKSPSMNNMTNYVKSLNKILDGYAVVFEIFARWMKDVSTSYPEFWKIVSSALVYHSTDIGAHPNGDRPFRTVEDVLAYGPTVSKMKDVESDIVSRAHTLVHHFETYHAVLTTK